MSTSPTFGDNVLHSVLGQVNQEFARSRVRHHRSDRKFNDDVFSVFATLVSQTMSAAIRFMVIHELKVVEGALAAVGQENNVATSSAVSAVGPATRNVLFGMERNRAAAPFSRGELYNGLVKEHNR
jgi:hypothetical protein